MEWGLIFVTQVAVVFATLYLCAGLLEDTSWFLTGIGLIALGVFISLCVKLFKVSLSNGFTGLGIALVVAIISFLFFSGAKDEKTGPWD